MNSTTHEKKIDATRPNSDNMKNGEQNSTHNHYTITNPDHDTSDDPVIEDITTDKSEPEKVKNKDKNKISRQYSKTTQIK